MYRYAMESLKRWKKDERRKPLLVYGARQVGKTWLMKEFGRTEFRDSLYLSLDTNKLARTIFENDIAPDALIPALESNFHIKIDPEHTLLIFDEIQECQRAKDSLKAFNENAPQYHIIAAGSFLGVAYGKFPVGQVSRITVYPMSFYEFLEANGRKQIVDMLRGLNPAMIRTVSCTTEELLKTYFYVGGMPSAVQAYAETKDIHKVREIQDNILNDYKGDFSKHITPIDMPKVRMLWESIPVHLAKEKKKFIYKEIKVGGRAAEFENAMDWLIETGLVYKIMRTENALLPLLAYQQRDIFKLFTLDVGLLCAQSGVDVRTLLQPDANIFEHFRGALTEQFVLQELKASGKQVPILYWANETGHSEIDFIMQYDGDIIPIEAKSAENARAKSLKVYMEKEKPARAVRTSLRNYGVTDNLYSIPLYMMGSFFEILDRGPISP